MIDELGSTGVKLNNYINSIGKPPLKKD